MVPSPPQESVNMIMDPIETLAHVGLSGDTQPFSLSLSFESYKLDSSDSSDAADKGLVCDRSQSRRSAAHPATDVTSVGDDSRASGERHVRQQKQQRKRTISPDLLPPAIQVDKKRKRATPVLHQRRQESEADCIHSQDESSSSSDSPNDTLNTPVSKQTDGRTFFPSIVSAINDPIPITGTADLSCKLRGSVTRSPDLTALACDPTTFGSMCCARLSSLPPQRRQQQQSLRLRMTACALVCCFRFSCRALAASDASSEENLNHHSLSTGKGA